MNDENPFIEAKRQEMLYIMNEHIERARLALYLSLIILLYSIVNMVGPYFINEKWHLHFWDPMFFVVGLSMTITMIFAEFKIRKEIKRFTDDNTSGKKSSI